MELSTKRLKLRELQDDDLKQLVKLADSLVVSQHLEKVPNPYTEKDGEWFINHCREESTKNPRTSYELAIIFEDTFVGVIGITNISEYNGTGTIGYWLGQEYWRRGIMYEANKAILDFAFNTLKLRRINIEAYTGNVGSNELIKKLGYTFEGMRRAYKKTMSTGKIVDTNQYGMLKEDWEKLQ